jgi:DNA-binding NarL/FixJ family response regulator
VACIGTDLALTVVFEGARGPLSAQADVAVVSEHLACESFECPILVCSNNPGAASPRSSLNRIMATLPRGALTEEQLVATVRAAAAGLRVDVGSVGRGTEEGTVRQRSVEILLLLAEGADTREISRAIGYSERTIKNEIQEAERKLGARTRAQAVAQAIRQGLIPALVLVAPLADRVVR